ncbi:MAG: hypothetical protein FWE21_02795 [Defluviitaleaceae bacterium]|nr:hypothetical protein [Defluviitaleaceae bacterium]
MKRFLLSTLAFFMLLFFVACSNNESEADDYNDNHENEAKAIMVVDIEFNNANPIMARITNYAVTAQIGNRAYFFHDADEAATEFVNIAEAIILQLENYIAIPYFRLQIYNTPNPKNYRFSHVEISVNFDNNDTFGWLANQLSRNHLPMWLSVGLEAYVKTNLGIFAPTDSSFLSGTHFSDLSFAPNMQRTTERNIAINMAYDFTSHLSESDILLDLVALYQTGHTYQANEKASRHFYNHFGWHMHTAMINMVNSTIAITSGVDVITFFFNCLSDIPHINDIANYIEYIRNAIDFTVDFMAQFTDFEAGDIRVDIYYDEEATIAFAFNDWITIRGALILTGWLTKWCMRFYIGCIASRVFVHPVILKKDLPCMLIPFLSFRKNLTINLPI